jgi:hypothetical protein
LEVRCEGLPSARAQLVVTAPPPGTPQRGAIIFATGGDGREFTAAEPAADGLLRMKEGMKQLVLGGYTAVDRRWVDGWFGQIGLGIRTPSCRFATLARYVQSRFASSVPLCATGNSGGSSEVGYSLAHWDGSARLRLAVLTGGPPMGRLDVGCLGDAALAGWRERCHAEWARTQTECPASLPPACTLLDRSWAAAPRLVDSAFATATHTERCTGEDLTARELFLAESVAAPGKLFTYPTTRVRFLVGRADCTEALIIGMLYREVITSAVEESVISGMRHQVAATQAGVTALVNALSDCGG